METNRSVAEMLRTGMDTLTATERKIARVLLANYPMAGLETIAQLAARVEVSGPTVLRLVGKLGFDSYSAFQATLRQELETRLQSPLVRRDPDIATEADDFLGNFVQQQTRLMQQTAANVSRTEFDGAAALLADPKRRILLLGGRLTEPLAAYLAHHLKVIRPQVTLLRTLPASWADHLVDMDKNDVLVIFDIRRYWQEAQHMAEMAAERKVQIVLFTDQWLSPVSRHARYTLAAHTAGPAGWDANTPLLMLADALIAAITTRHWDDIQQRIHALEAMRSSLGEREA